MDPIVEVAQGRLRGRIEGGVAVFRGIPYGGPVTGLARFQAPAPATSWSGVRDAVDFGPTAPKPPYAPPFDQLLFDPVVPGDDCLNLNVWTPDPGGSGLPVMVWVHGGAFRAGSSAVPVYGGAAFARDGVVLVSVNYRLGVAGFGAVEGAPANLGLRDQLAALAWVQDNIAGFGGDPSRVTIFGESAGAMAVSSLVSMKAGEGLFHRAIAQSGAADAAAELHDARRVTAELAAKLGVPPTAQALAAVDTARLIASQQEVALELTTNPDPDRWGRSVITAGGGLMAFFPTVDGELMTARPVDAIAAGAGSRVAMLVGTTTEEMRFFLVPVGLTVSATSDAVRARLTAAGIDPAVLDTYAASRPGASPGDLLAAIRTDSFFRIPAVRLAEAHLGSGGQTHAYEFGWRPTAHRLDLGACHAMELGFVFDTLSEPTGQWLTGPNPPQQLADRMHAAWVSFARDGDPGWPPYDLANRPVMTFDDPECAVVDDPRSEERTLWDGLI